MNDYRYSCISCVVDQSRQKVLHHAPSYLRTISLSAIITQRHRRTKLDSFIVMQRNATYYISRCELVRASSYKPGEPKSILLQQLCCISLQIINFIGLIEHVLGIGQRNRQTSCDGIVCAMLTLCGLVLRSTHMTKPDQSCMKKPIRVHLILFSLFLKQFRMGASTVSWSKLFHLSMTRFEKKIFPNIRIKSWFTIFSQPSIYIDGWVYGMSMTSVVCNVPVLSQNDSTYHHSVFTT